MTIMTGELAPFQQQVRSLYETLSGSAQFSTLEGQLTLSLLGDGMGLIKLRGEVLDQAGIGNRLVFQLQFDQTELRESLTQLDAVVAAFPIRGSRQ